MEQRIAHGDNKRPTLSAYGPSLLPGTDFKRKWRVKRAKKELIQRFGLLYIRRVVAYTVVFMLVLVALIVVEVTGSTRVFTAIYASVVGSIDAALGAIAGLVATVLAIVPSFKLAFASNQESSVSRGEVIFKQASSVKDQLGFLESVKRDLQELFIYLREFEEQLKTQIVIVPIVDDLDRCITDGRNVKVLEAMQLILSVPGAPIISFLAVDSRVVVASIEDYYEKVFEKTNISGFEYLDKVVQIPFALPEPPPEKVERLLSKNLEGESAKPEQVAQRLKVFGAHGRKLLTAFSSHESKQVLTFKVAATKSSPMLAVPLRPIVQAIENFGSLEGIKDSQQALKLVRATARQLGSSLGRLADRLRPDDEEAVEILCREINAALEAGNVGFDEAPPHSLYTIWANDTSGLRANMLSIYTVRTSRM